MFSSEPVTRRPSSAIGRCSSISRSFTSSVRCMMLRALARIDFSSSSALTGMYPPVLRICGSTLLNTQSWNSFASSFFDWNFHNYYLFFISFRGTIPVPTAKLDIKIIATERFRRLRLKLLLLLLFCYCYESSSISFTATFT